MTTSKVPRRANRRKPTVEAQIKLSITSGPASLAQQASYRRFWQKLIAEVRASEQ